MPRLWIYGGDMDQIAESREFNLYRDIKNRTGGEIYIGVVGPVRTGKSTFIKRYGGYAQQGASHG